VTWCGECDWNLARRPSRSAGGSTASRSPHKIVVDAAFNAYWTVVGVRRTRVLALGLPLLYALDHEQLVALVAHEVELRIRGELASHREDLAARMVDAHRASLY
jgi:hypothetical protein